jgi:urease beta subunit
VDEGDFAFGNALRYEPGAEVVIDVETVRGGRREIAKDELR